MRFLSPRPDPMRVAPGLPPPRRGTPVPRTILLVNPFYPKDPNASFGKHVLTPTLALTSLAGATPGHWSVRYQLEEGYAWIYRRLFGLGSIWARRPKQTLAVAPYLAMSMLYKRSNWLWQLLIERRLTHAAWTPLVQLTRWRHLAHRGQLLHEGEVRPGLTAPAPPGV